MIIRYAYLAVLRRELNRFLADSNRARAIQRHALADKIERGKNSDFGREHSFCEMRTVADFRKRVPIRTYDDHRPYLNKVLHGNVNALFAPGTKVLMFAMTSGTTGEPKRLPITEQFFREYRRGWMIWGASVYGDYPHLLRKKSLHLCSDWQQFRSASGIPCGQISGLAATTRPRISQLLFLPPHHTMRIHDSSAKHYATLRFALASKKVGKIVTANPSTLIEFARRANENSESLIRDIHDGTLSAELPASVRSSLARPIARRNPARARELSALVGHHGALIPKHAWPELSVLAVWTGGTVGMFLPRLPELYGNAAVRDHGLSASEGRMTIPIADNTSAGLLDFCHHFFEFIPVAEYGSLSPTVLEAHELTEGCDYYILLTTSGGLYRYDIHDVVRCVGFRGQAPLLEFLNKGKNFSNLTGEKVSEHQVVRAVEKSFTELGLPLEFFALAPLVKQVPGYVLLLEPEHCRGREHELATRVHANLGQLNEEYASKCASGRLSPITVRHVPAGTWLRLRAGKKNPPRNLQEEKQTNLFPDLTFFEKKDGPKSHSSPLPPPIPLT